MMEKSIAILGSALTRSTKSQKIPNGGISSNQKHRSRSRQRDRYSYYRKSRSRLPQRFIKSSRHYTVISMAVDHPPSISHLISLNWMLMMNTRNTPITMMLIRKMSCKVVVTIQIWVTCLLRSRKQLHKLYIRRVKTLQIQIWLRWEIGAGWRNPLKLQWWSALQRGWKSKATAILQNINEEIPNNKKILS